MDRISLFVYGTLQSGQVAHHYLAGARFVGRASTAAGYTLYDAGGYPALVAGALAGGGVEGEVYEVSSGMLAAMDRYEGVAEGLYVREPIELTKDDGTEVTAQAYRWCQPWAQLRHVGRRWSRDP